MGETCIEALIFGLSQENLGFECGLYRTYIGSIEREETNLSRKYGRANYHTSL